MAKGLAWLYDELEVVLYQEMFSYILLLLRQGILFLIPRTSLYQGLFSQLVDI